MTLREHDLTPQARFNLTCPLCQKLQFRNGTNVLDQHLRDEHGLTRDKRFAVYKQQVADWNAA